MLSVIIALSFVLSLLGQTVQTKAETIQEYNNYKYTVLSDGKNVSIVGYKGTDKKLEFPQP